MKKVLIVATVPSMIGQFNMNNISVLQELGYEVHVGCNFKDRSIWDDKRVDEFEKQLCKCEIKYFQIDFARNVFDYLEHKMAYLQLKKILICNKYFFVHCHTPIAAAICRIVAHKTKTKCIYTAHGFHFYTGAPIFNWLFFYPIEKLLSKWTDVLITINQEDYKRAKKKLYAKRIEYVPGVGINTKVFSSFWIDREEKREELGILGNQIMLYSDGELDDRRKYETIIRAVKKIDNPNILYFIAGRGDEKGYLQKLILELKLEKQVIMLGERKDVPELCQATDLFLFTSYERKIPYSVIEAIASQTPMISSETQRNKRIVKGPYFDENNIDSVVLVLKEALSSEQPLRQAMRESISDNFDNLRTFDFLKNVSDVDVFSDRKMAVRRVLEQQKFKKELGIALDSIVLLSVGELNKNKNHSTVVKSLAKLKNKNIHYCIAGIGNLENEIEKLAEELGVSERVHLLGYRNDISELLQKVDVYLLPSIREGLNVSLLEAMAAGLPCICSDIRGNSDLIENNKGGIRVRSKDVISWKNVMEEINKLGYEYGRFNMQKVKDFSIENVNLCMMNIYKGV